MLEMLEAQLVAVALVESLQLDQMQLPTLVVAAAVVELLMELKMAETVDLV
jgi:hypothetical protein